MGNGVINNEYSIHFAVPHYIHNRLTKNPSIRIPLPIYRYYSITRSTSSQQHLNYCGTLPDVGAKGLKFN